MAKTKKQPTKISPYIAMGKELETAAAALESAEAGLLTLELVSAEDEAEITRQAILNTTVTEGFEQVRHRLRSNHPIEVANEAKRKAKREALYELTQRSGKFVMALQCDLSNPLATTALERLSANLSTLQLGKLMIGMAESLANPPAGAVAAKKGEAEPAAPVASSPGGSSYPRAY